MRSKAACEAGFISAEPPSKKPTCRTPMTRPSGSRRMAISLRLISAARAVSKKATVMNIEASYREATFRGANPMQLVVGLYEQRIEDLRPAPSSGTTLCCGPSASDTRFWVIGHLQSSLDFSKGGKIAQDLDNFLQRPAHECRVGAISSLETRRPPGDEGLAGSASSVDRGGTSGRSVARDACTKCSFRSSRL